MRSNLFEQFAHKISHLSGKPVAFGAACLVVVAWAVTGPVFGFSETWQLVINTGTTIVTFLMVFVLQNSQNRDGQAVQAKLDELILVSTKAENTFIGAEQLSEVEIHHLRALIAERAARSAARHHAGVEPQVHGGDQVEPAPLTKA